MDKYNFMFEYLKKSTKEEHHIDEMESFARKHPILFMKFHKYSKPIENCSELSREYLDAKSELEKMFNDHKDDFSDLFKAVEEKYYR